MEGKTLQAASEQVIEYVWRPQSGPQHALFECPLPLIFFGGARGGGKTDGVLGKWAAKEQDYGPDFNAIAFRRTTVSFEDAVERGKEIYCPMGARYLEKGNRPFFKMPNGGRISFRYLETTSDAQEYQGRNVTDVWIEEAGQYGTSDAIDRLFGVLRSAAGVPVQMILTANPGGPGQHWLRDRFRLYPLPVAPQDIDINVNSTTIRAAVIPSRVQDNRILLESDPEYIKRLHLVGSAALVKAWLDGDWSAIEGAFFDCWSDKMILRPQKLPDWWTRFRSADWGYAAPFSVGWWAVASDDFKAITQSGAPITIPRDAIIRYREWYGARSPNKGLRMDAELVADGIAEREAGENVKYGVLDPSAFAEDGGPSIAERMYKRRVTFGKADNKRVGQKGAVSGWDQMRARMVGNNPELDEKGAVKTITQPMIYTFSTCKDSIRTIPTLQHDEKKAEDLDTDSEDHAADEWRYACMSRPLGAKPPKNEQPQRDEFTPKPETFEDLRQENIRRAKRRRF